jgi:hypothetical protein
LIYKSQMWLQKYIFVVKKQHNQLKFWLACRLELSRNFPVSFECWKVKNRWRQRILKPLFSILVALS